MSMVIQKVRLCKRGGYSITPEYGDVYDIDLLIKVINKKTIPTGKILVDVLRRQKIESKIIKGVLFFENKIDVAEAIRIISNSQ